MVPAGTSVIALSTKTRSMPSQNMIIDPDQISSDSVDIAHRVFALFRVMLYSEKKIFQVFSFKHLGFHAPQWPGGILVCSFATAAASFPIFPGFRIPKAGSDKA